MKQTLQLKLSQHLALTPQLQQSIRLLQLSTLELNQEIEQFLSDNPLLERIEPNDGSAFMPGSDALATPQPVAEDPPTPTYDEDYNVPSDSNWSGDAPSNHSPRDSNDGEDSDYADIQAAAISLRDHLGAQLGFTPLSERDRSMVNFLIEALDEDGYLAQDLEELLDLLAV
ncbi:MAG: RNA polymerase factor sigma-54, partial [Proteobacteria bacterium]|nr:RNA polymerase factor sigma-54 [Pseudomonadota bacterium]